MTIPSFDTFGVGEVDRYVRAEFRLGMHLPIDEQFNDLHRKVSIITREVIEGEKS